MSSQTLSRNGPSVQIAPDFSVHGLFSPSGIANFLGIRYATIPARFRLSRLLPLDRESHRDNDAIDATEYGPVCSQPADTLIDQRRYLLEGLGNVGNGPMHVEDSLRVNIYVPPKALEPGADSLPVYAWIHGGGWTTGDGNTNANYLVQRAIEIGQPFIFVGINYRLGFHGFLSSNELEEEAKQNGETYFANKGVHDQRIALQWIQRHIHYFGGNADNVTIAGESAGGWCVFAHLVSDVPVCRRGIIQSCPVWTFRPVEEAQATFDRLVGSKGVSASASADDKLAALRSLSDDECETLLNGVYARPVWDPNWFVYQDEDLPFQDISQFPDWVQGVILGWTKDEMALWMHNFKGLSSPQMEKWIFNVSPDRSFAQELMDSYRVGEKYAQQDSLAGLLQMATDSVFGCLPVMVGATQSPPISIFRFDQADTFQQSRMRGYSYHSLDVVFLFRSLPVAGPNADRGFRTTADQMTEMCARFVYGQQPWGTFQQTNEMMIFDGQSSRLVKWPPTSEDARWKSFVSTKERMAWFGQLGRLLLAGKSDI